jgi:hypothetical protein
MMSAISAGLRFIASVAAGGQPSFSRQPLGPAPLTWPSQAGGDPPRLAGSLVECK